MTPDTPPRSAFPIPVWLLVLMAALLPWAVFQAGYALREDITWLVEAGQRLLNGGHYITDVFEINPPLSILLYLPLAVSTDLAHSSLPFAFLIYILGLTALFAGLTNAVIKRYGFLDAPQRAVFIAGLILICTVLPEWVEFGQREQVIFMGILPLILLQAGMTLAPAVKRGPEFWPTVILGSIAMLIKPHYGVFAVALMLIRMMYQRRWLVLLDRDFLTLAIITASYIAGVMIILPDYFFHYLPDVARFYATFGSGAVILERVTPYLALLALLSAGTCLLPFNTQVKRLLWIMIGCSALSLIPYAVQLKGFSYQLIPAKSFAFCAITLMVCGGQGFPARLFKAPLTGLLFLIVLIYALNPPNPKFTTHTDYKDLPLTKKVAACGPNCRFFLYVYGASMTHTTAYYSDKPLTSRFGDLSILIGTYMEYERLKAGTSRFTREELDHRFEHYVHMFTEDIVQGKPDQIFICQNCANDPFFNFLSIMSRDPSFADEWKNYREEETFTIDRGAYYKGTKAEAAVPLTFKSYARIAP